MGNTSSDYYATISTGATMNAARIQQDFVVVWGVDLGTTSENQIITTTDESAVYVGWDEGQTETTVLKLNGGTGNLEQKYTL